MPDDVVGAGVVVDVAVVVVVVVVVVVEVVESGILIDIVLSGGQFRDNYVKAWWQCNVVVFFRIFFFKFHIKINNRKVRIIIKYF